MMLPIPQTPSASAGRHTQIHSHLCRLVLVGLLTFGMSEATGKELRIKHRGKQIRTEHIKTTRKPFFRCRLALSEDAFPRFCIDRFALLTHYEVPIYEVLLEIKQEGEQDRTNIEYVLVPDEEMRGEIAVRTEEEAVGVAADETFTLNGREITTDSEGVYTDREQTILTAFDDLSRRELDLEISHKELGNATLTIRRDLVLQRAVSTLTAERIAPVPDLMIAMGLDFEQKRNSSHDGLRVRTAAPTEVVRGKGFSVVLEAHNTGEKDVSSVLLRTFSRHAWLHGKVFYIGGLKPGEKRTFERVFSVPADAPLQKAFVEIGCWDILGAIPEQNQVLEIAVVSPDRQPE